MADMNSREFNQYVKDRMQEYKDVRPDEIMKQAPQPINKRGGLIAYNLTLTDADLATANGRRLQRRGYGLIIPSGNFTGVNVRIYLDFDSGGPAIPVTPGTRIDAVFENFAVRVEANGGAISGAGTIVVFTEPDVKMLEGISSSAVAGGAGGSGSLSQNVVLGTAAGSSAGAYNPATSSTTNIPSGIGDGVALPVGARGAIAVISASAAQTVTGGTFVWWRYLGVTGRWYETSVQEVHPTGRRDVMGSDQLLTAFGTADRLFVEWRSGTVSGGAAPLLTLQVNN